MSSKELQKSAIENPTLELKIVSANNVSHNDASDKMDVYAVVLISGNTSQQKQTAKTPIDNDGGSNPTWNHTVKFSVNEKEAKEGLVTVKVKLFSYWLESENDLYLGEVNVSVQELLASNPIPLLTNGKINKMKSMSCPITVIGEVIEESTMKPTLSLSYRFKPVPVNDVYLPVPDTPPPSENPPSVCQIVDPKPDPAIIVQPVVVPPPFETATKELILDLVIKFAKNIEDVNAFSAMDVYASVAIIKDRKVKSRYNTSIDFAAYKNPKWDHEIKFYFDEKLAEEGQLILLVELISHRPFLGDKVIGEVRLPIQRLLRSNPPYPLTNTDNDKGMKLETHALTGPYGKKGVVSFTYRFLAKEVTVLTEPPPTTEPQQYITVRYLPPTQMTSSNATVEPGVNAKPNSGLVPIYMPPLYQSHEHQQYSPPPLPKSLPQP